MIDSVVTWNVGPGRHFRDLLLSLHRLIEADDDVVALFEMSLRNTRLLRVATRARWRVLRPRVGRRGDRRSDVVVMIRRRLPMPDITLLVHDVPWIGPKEGLAHHGRAHLQLNWDDDDRIIFVHRVPGGPKGGVNPRTEGQNLEAWQADATLLRAALKRPGPAAVLGDQNASADELRGEYEPMGLTVHATVSKVDHGASRGYPRARGRRLGKFGSDHPAVRWRLR